MLFIYSTCLSILLLSCGKNKSKDSDAIPEFVVTHPLNIDTIYNNEFIADIQSIQNVELRARVKGFIEKIYVDEGKPVQSGQILFTISNHAFNEELLKANAQLKSTVADLRAVEVEIKNTKILTDKNIVAKSELEMLQAKKDAILARIEDAKSTISMANLNLSLTQVKAPFSGVINRIPLKTGSFVEDGTLLTSISNNKEVFAYFNVSEKEYLNIEKAKEPRKREVSLLMADNQLFDQKGIIETAENEIDKTTGNIAFRARFFNPQQLLKHGSSGKILIKEDLKNVLIIPQKSTFEIQDKTYVYIVDKNNIVRMRSIVTGLRLTHLYIVKDGLTANDTILYEGVQQLKEGDKINPKITPLNNLLLDIAK